MEQRLTAAGRQARRQAGRQRQPAPSPGKHGRCPGRRRPRFPAHTPTAAGGREEGASATAAPAHPTQRHSTTAARTRAATPPAARLRGRDAVHDAVHVWQLAAGAAGGGRRRRVGRQLHRRKGGLRVGQARLAAGSCGISLSDNLKNPARTQLPLRAPAARAHLKVSFQPGSVAGNDSAGAMRRRPSNTVLLMLLP